MPDKLYTVHNWQAFSDHLQCDITYHADHPIFTGHFPGQPVVPGVCTMDMVKELLQEALGKKLLLRRASPVKFLRLILPDAHPQVSISWQKTESGYQVTASLKENGQDLFKMNGVFEGQ